MIVFGYTDREVLIAHTEAQEKNDVGKIITIDGTNGYALITRPIAQESKVTPYITKSDAEYMQKFMPINADHIKYNCEWLFYFDEKNNIFRPGIPPTIPSFNAKVSFLKEPSFLKTMIPIYTEKVIENNLIEKHMDFLLLFAKTHPIDDCLYKYVYTLTQYAIKTRSDRILSIIDALMENPEVQNRVKRYIENNPLNGNITSVEDGKIIATMFDIPPVGGLYKFNSKNKIIFGNVLDVKYNFPYMNVSNALQQFIRERFIGKTVTYKPLATKDKVSGRVGTAISEYPDYGEKILPINSEDIRLMYPGQGKLGKYNDYPVNFDIDRVKERSIGVFGKSGSGKSTATRLITAQYIQHGETLLIFDEHKEYGKTHKAEGRTMYGFQDIFPQKVKVVTFGNLSYQTPDKKTHQADIALKIPVSMITAEDILQVGDALRLSGGASKVMAAIERKLKSEWRSEYGSLVEAILFLSPAHFIEITEGVSGDDAEVSSALVHKSSLDALRQSLSSVFLDDETHFKDYYTTEKPNKATNSIGLITEWLKAGNTVIVNSVAKGFVLISNIIFRLVVNEWQKSATKHLTILIEEAHRLIPSNNHTLVVDVAREMRKYGVTLMIVDQTPNKIDPIAIKQIGTYFVFRNEISESKTVMPEDAPVSEIISRLAPLGEVFVWGHAFMLPSIIKLYDYETIAEEIIAKSNSSGSGFLDLSIDKESKLNKFYGKKADL